jgi:hypothetical protein
MRLVLSILALWLASVPITRDDAPGPGLCLAAWESADRNRDGILDGREATLFLALMHLHKASPPEDGRIGRSRFMAACGAGAFRTGFTPD